jgi:protein phosphatase
MIGVSQSLQILSGGESRAGKRGRQNQDAIRIVHPAGQAAAERGSLLIVADGLGGHSHGEVASMMLCEELPRLYYGSPHGECIEWLRGAVIDANRMLYAASSAAGDRHGMCTTLVAAAVVGNTLAVANVGDSIGVLVRAGQAVYRSPEHCVNIRTFDSGERRLLTQSIGARPEVVPAIVQMALEEGDVIVLCSDGLSDSLPLTEIVTGCVADEPAVAATRLVNAAQKCGATDDISIVIASLTRSPS